MAEKKNKEIKKAVQTLDIISMDPKERERYETILQAEFNQRISNQKFLEEGIKKGLKEGIEKGIEKGKAEGEKKKGLEIAEKLLEKGIDIKNIAEITEISEEEIENLKKNN